ncbi:hypothetical protein KCP69_23360 [Salmonella enterica subsp. enterica]|nr:hypothetical protein KCP69_23360 [Salmonella enterica subsp. enterica]
MKNKIASHVRGIIVLVSNGIADAGGRRRTGENLLLLPVCRWRQSGCFNIAYTMNEDVLSPGDRCASGTNRILDDRALEQERI